MINVFGKDVVFSYAVQKTAKSQYEESADNTEMYVPQEIVILSPCATAENEINPLCYYEDFILRWNKDEKNTNGVLVLLEWYGGMVLGEDIKNTYVRRIASFPDTGEARLPERLFDGIPDTAYCNLTVLRGNIKIIESENYSYKIIGETHHLISFILIRYLKSK